MTALGSPQLELKCDDATLSNFAFSFKLRRYTRYAQNAVDGDGAESSPLAHSWTGTSEGGTTNVWWQVDLGRAVQVDTIKTHLESASGFSA